MAADPELIRGLERAVLDDPSNVSLRVHLVGMLLDDGQAAAALGHAEAGLRSSPEHDDLKRLAATARSLLGAAGPDDGDGRERGDGARRERERAGGGDDADLATLFEIVRPEVTLDDVAGMERVKTALRTSFLEPMRNEELRRMYGASLRGGLLLYGPPGCGKTFLARAVAGELGVYFMSLGLTDVLDMWLGNSEKNLRGLFDTAREMAPAVVFIDEIDALGHKRSRFRADSAGRNVVNQLLTELDGIDGVNEGVYVIAATNQPWDVDTALRRPGRFDRTVLVLPPDLDARRAILAATMRDRPLGVVDLDAIASATELFSGADLVAVCDDATRAAMAEAIESGTARPIAQRDLAVALQNRRPSTLEWLRMARNHAEFANHDGVYDELLEYLTTHRIT